MKKTIILVLTALMLVGLLAGCTEDQYINIIDDVEEYRTEFFIVTGMTWQQFIDENTNVTYESNVLKCKFQSPNVSPEFYEAYYYNTDSSHVYQASERVMNLDLNALIEGNPVFICRCVPV